MPFRKLIHALLGLMHALLGLMHALLGLTHALLGLMHALLGLMHVPGRWQSIFRMAAINFQSTPTEAGILSNLMAAGALKRSHRLIFANRSFMSSTSDFSIRSRSRKSGNEAGRSASTSSWPHVLLGAAIVLAAAWAAPATGPDDADVELHPAGEGEILSTVEIPEGYAATVFARPPQISYPTFVKPAYDGPVFVAVDKNSSLDVERGRGSVAICYDDDENGEAERCSPFIPEIDSPRGLEWDGEWLYVMHPPHLSAYRDSDGDGVADESRRLVDGIAFSLDERPADHTSNGVTLGIDGYLYLAIGDFGFMEAVGADGTTLQLRGGGVARVRTDGSDLEIFSRGTRNIYEVAVDPYLNVFARDNTNDGGGWDVRLHQFTGLEHHGYPSLYANFKEEIVQPLADYGGGSGTGAHYLYEPGFPNEDGNRLYTADWGRSGVYRHTLERDGASFRETVQDLFFKIDRVTDLDVDGRSRLYASSWSGGRYRYSGDDVGYVLRITPEDYAPSEFPDLTQMAVPELVSLFERPSATLHLAAQQEILRREPDALPSAEQLAVDDSRDRAARVAALFTLQQVLGTRALPTLEALAGDPEIGALAVRALGDPHLAPSVDPSVLTVALESADARKRLEGAVAVSRTGNADLADELLPLTADPDPVVAHTATKALVKLHAVETSLAALDDPAIPNSGVFRVLQEMHDEELVDALIDKLNEDLAPDVRSGILSVLARLAVREGEWDGSSWGTRPDTQGPYYQRDVWAATDKIEAALRRAINDPETDKAALLAAMAVNQLIDASYLPEVRALAEQNLPLEAAYVQALLMQDETPPDAVPLLKRIAAGDDRQGNVRMQAAQALARTGDRDASRFAFRVIGGDFPAYSQVASAAREALVDHPIDVLGIDWLLDATASGAEDEAALAWGVLLQHVYDPNAPQTDKARIQARIDDVESDPTAYQALLQAVRSFRVSRAEDLVRDALTHSNDDVRSEAERTARALRLDLAGDDDTPKIGTMDSEEVAQAVRETEGDVALGEILFDRATCSTCHTVDPDEPLKGPFLGNIAATFDREELTMAILDPSATIAQGFVTNAVTLKDGSTVTGFVSREGADEVVLRDASGRTMTVSVDDIEERRTLPVSMMPPGLASDLSVHELASLLAYLEKMDEEQ